MKADFITIVQNHDSGYNELVRQAAGELNLHIRYSSFPSGQGGEPNSVPALILWDLSGYSQSECSLLAGALGGGESGLLLLCPRADQLCEDTRHLAGALGAVVQPRQPRELTLAIQMALATFQRLLALRNQLTEADRELRDRRDIEEAKRMIMRRTGCNENQAMRKLQNRSRNSNTKLADLARQVVQNLVEIG